MLSLQLKAEKVFNDVLSILVGALEGLAPRLENGVEGLVCVLLLVMP